MKVEPLQMKSESDYGSQKQLPVKKTIFILLIIMLLIALGFFGWRKFCDYRLSREFREHTTESTTANPDALLADNPIDFDELMQQNNEIYAWISIPNTDIEQPILQSRTDDLYYVKKDVDKKYSRLGSIFTQGHNKRNFSDPVTVVYGHNYLSGGMFTNLHYFENEDFFKENEYFYIFLPGRKLTYYIVSAYKYDDRHILNTFDFSDTKVLREYFDYVMNPHSLLKNIREDAALSEDDKLVVLSTCLTYGYSGRYLVNGVLTKDERTK